MHTRTHYFYIYKTHITINIEIKVEKEVYEEHKGKKKVQVGFASEALATHAEVRLCKVEHYREAAPALVQTRKIPTQLVIAS